MVSSFPFCPFRPFGRLKRIVRVSIMLLGGTLGARDASRLALDPSTLEGFASPCRGYDRNVLRANCAEQDLKSPSRSPRSQRTQWDLNGSVPLLRYHRNYME